MSTPGGPVRELTGDERDHLYVLFHDSRGLRVCGCGTPEDAWRLVHDLLEATAATYDADGRFRGWTPEGQHPYDQLCGNPGSASVVCGALEETGLIEHGGSFYGSWLTTEGFIYLDLLRAIGGSDDIGDDTGYPHDGNGCPPGCPLALPWMRAEG